jgi:hypothetical protein
MIIFPEFMMLVLLFVICVLTLAYYHVIEVE